MPLLKGILQPVFYFSVYFRSPFPGPSVSPLPYRIVMKKLTTVSPFFYKRLFPVIWFGFVGFFLLIAFFVVRKENWSDMLFFVIPIIMAVFGYFLMKELVFDLIDEVYDEGSSLLLKNRGKEVRVNLKDIKNISYSTMVTPPRVTLSIRYITELGDELSFSPPMRFISFMKNSDIEELIDRIDRARG